MFCFSLHPKTTKRDAFAELMGSRVWPATMASIGVVILQQISGQPSVLYYAATIFEKAGVESSATIAVGWFKVCAQACEDCLR